MSDSCNPGSTTGKVIRRKLKKGATYSYDFVQVAARMTAAGMTVKDVGFVLGVKPTTVTKWKERYSEFGEACRDGKEIAKQYLVANGLRTALGYDYEEVDQVFVKDTEKGDLVLQKETRKLRHRPVDKDLMMFFLINLDRGQGNWKNVKSVEIEQKKTTTNINISANLESSDIRKLAGVAFKEADRVDRMAKKVESKVIEAEVIKEPDNNVANSEFLESILDE